MNDSEIVSIVIPCYNQGRFLAEAIESVLNQNYQNFEIIVINDGSTDETSRIAANYSSVRLIEQNNRGLSAARNNGLKECRGKFVVFLDADDTLLSNALEIGVKTLNEHPECVCAAGLCQLVDVDGNDINTIQPILYSNDDYYLSLLRNNFIWAPSSVIYRRDLFERIEAFDVDLSPAADYELYLRIARNYPMIRHSGIVTNYRRHSTSMSGNAQFLLEYVMRVLERQKEFTSGHKNYRKALKHGIAVIKIAPTEMVYYQLSQSVKRGNFAEASKYGKILLSNPLKMPRLFYRLLYVKIKILSRR